VDYPISVPSVGLVGGKFVDEDPVAGTPGSLIPSAWGNAVTDEILNVIIEAGLTPDEENNAQLKEAILAIITDRETATTATQLEAEDGVDNTKRMTPLRVFQAIAKKVVQATEAAFGWAKIATQTQVDAGLDDATIVTPKKLLFGIDILLSPTIGYIRFPSWCKRFTVAWGSALNNTPTTLPIGFTAPPRFAGLSNSLPPTATSYSALSGTSVTCQTANGNSVGYIAVGFS
jgi:hypothetical protein